MAAGGMAAGELAGAYPVEFDVEYPEAPQRWMILIRWLLAIPHLIIVGVLELVAQVFWLIGIFVILFTGRLPGGMAELIEGWLRWTNNAMAYVLFLDRYPPFSMADGEYPGVTTRVSRLEQPHRWLPLVKWLLAIPHYIVLAVLGFVAYFVVIWLVVAVLVTGQYPRPAFDYLVGVGRWTTRVSAYVFLLVDDYPPFSHK
jgi:hypothetical protein